jgi:hypothetical protein
LFLQNTIKKVPLKECEKENTSPYGEQSIPKRCCPLSCKAGRQFFFDKNNIFLKVAEKNAKPLLYHFQRVMKMFSFPSEKISKFFEKR